MPFLGTPVVKKVSDSLYRITGVSLAADSEGTIGLNAAGGGPGDIDLMTPDWGQHGDVTLQDAIEIDIHAVDTPVVSLTVGKAGTTHADFLATITNPGEGASGELEIYVRFYL